MLGLGTREIILIFFLILLLFGSRKLPELARSLGKGIKEFKKGAREITEDLELNEEEESKGKKEPVNGEKN